MSPTNTTSPKKSSRRKRAARAVCYRCKKPFSASRHQHPRYSFCPECKNYSTTYGATEAWLDRSQFGPYGGSSDLDA